MENDIRRKRRRSTVAVEVIKNKKGALYVYELDHN